MNRDLREGNCIYRNILHKGDRQVLFRHMHSGKAEGGRKTDEIYR